MKDELNRLFMDYCQEPSNKQLETSLFSMINEFYLPILLKNWQSKSNPEDVLQEACIKIYQRMNQYDPERASFTSWFETTILDFECLGNFRDTDRRNTREIGVSEIVVDNEFESETEMLDQLCNSNDNFPDFQNFEKADFLLISNILSNYGEFYEDVLRFYLFGDFTLKGIAHIMKEPDNTVRTRKVRGMERLIYDCQNVFN